VHYALHAVENRDTAEWYTGPQERPNINPFVLLDDVIPSRLALAFDKSLMEMWFIALDPERLGQYIECKDDDGNLFGHDFGDNAVNWRVKRKHDLPNDDSDNNSSSDDDDDDDSDDELNTAIFRKEVGKYLSGDLKDFLQCRNVKH
jgi:hypothetical protein